MPSIRAVLGLCIKLSLGLGLVIAPLAQGATDSAKLEVLQRWKLGGEGGWDYLTADPAKDRLFISRGTRVDVISTESGKLLGSIPDTLGVHGIALAKKSLLPGFAGEAQMRVMRELRRALDPNGILNPGKVF